MARHTTSTSNVRQHRLRTVVFAGQMGGETKLVPLKGGSTCNIYIYIHMYMYFLIVFFNFNLINLYRLFVSNPLSSGLILGT